MPATVTTLDAVLKNWYGDKNRLRTLLYEDHPFLDWIPKNPNGTGKKNVFPIVYGPDQGFGATLAVAQSIADSAGGGSALAEDWVCSWGDYVSDLKIDDKVIKMSASDMGSFIDAQKLAIDTHIKQWATVLETYLLRSKARNLGSFTIDTGVCTMVNPYDIVNIAKGMQVQASANDGSATAHTLLGSGSIGYVIGVNPNAGTFTVSATDGGAAGVPDSWTGTMYVFRRGDFGGTTTPPVVVDGYGDWIPSTDPTSTAFNGVDRTQNIVALSGTRLTATEIAGIGTERRIKKLCTKMGSRGFGYPSAVFTDPETWDELASAIESKTQRNPIGKTLGTGQFGFDTIQISTPGGLVPIYAVRTMPFGAIYALKKDAFKLDSLQGGCPQFINGDGLKFLRAASANQYEMRMVAYPSTEVVPGYCGRTVAA